MGSIPQIVPYLVRFLTFPSLARLRQRPLLRHLLLKLLAALLDGGDQLGAVFVVGCMVSNRAFLRAKQSAGVIKGDNPDQEAGIKLVLKAIEAPLREIVYNAGGEASVVVAAVMAGKGNYGFNAANDTYGDMIEMGILDPTKVTRTALQNAASVASLMLTTECMVAEAPKADAGGGMGGMGGGDMGGMGGMGGMGM